MPSKADSNYVPTLSRLMRGNGHDLKNFCPTHVGMLSCLSDVINSSSGPSVASVGKDKCEM